MITALASIGPPGTSGFVGEFLAGSFSTLWELWASPLISAGVGSVAGEGVLARVLLWGFDAGIEASLAIGLPYILTFYFLLGFLEDCLEDNLVVAPGSSFGPSYGTWIRLCFTCAPPDVVARGVEVLARRLGR